MKIIILIALRAVKFPEGGAAAPVAPPPVYALGFEDGNRNDICKSKRSKCAYWVRGDHGFVTKHISNINKSKNMISSSLPPK